MKVTQLALVLTVVNLAILVAGQVLPHANAAQGPVPVLRGSALELVDGAGRVRASITIHPERAAGTAADSQMYPETVVLRLIDQNGRPDVKLAASERGAVLSLVGESDRTQVILKAEGPDSSLKLATRMGREQIFKP
jgi:hypothetical protein